MQTIDPRGSFVKNLLLSLMLIGITSLVIPLVLKQIDDRKAADQQRFQDELSRQDTVLDAQATLLDTIASDFWQYVFYASDVVISRDNRFGEAGWHEKAISTYYDESGPLLSRMRADISTLLRLAPKSTYQEFLTFYNDDIQGFDACLLALLKDDQATPISGDTVAFTGCNWDTLANSVVSDELAGKLDQHLADLAQDFRLEATPAVP
ncbi:MAG: hypothetical protein QM692_15640 [Thermomicrobiales bacterium]